MRSFSRHAVCTLTAALTIFLTTSPLAEESAQPPDRGVSQLEEVVVFGDSALADKLCPETQYPIPNTQYPVSSDHSPAIQVEDLHYRYDDGPPALAGVNLSVEAGDFLAIAGQNGSGKTTLVKHFNGLLRPSRGRVWVLGQDTAGQSVGQLARKVGYLFQNPDHQIFAPTVWEEVAFGPHNLGFSEGEVAARTTEALSLFGLADQADIPPAVLGYGLRRKVTLAAVWAMRPRILVLDEPTVGLDWRSTRTLMEEVSNLNRQGHTIILVTHDMKLVAQFARQVLVLDEGRTLAYGPTRQLFQQEAILRQAFLAPPPISALARRMRQYGLRGDSLTVSEFYQEYGSLVWRGEK